MFSKFKMIKIPDSKYASFLTENLKKIYMKKIEAKIIADSMNQQGNRITTMILTFPRFILAELNTHRMFSKNSASSRAIPFNKMLKMVQEDPFIPIAWQSHHIGMQGDEYIIDPEKQRKAKTRWDEAKESAIQAAIRLDNAEVTKQLCNRLLEPFMWHTVLLTATEFDNFFNLRCPKYYFEPENIIFNSRKDFGSKYLDCFESDEFIDWSYEKWQSINKSGAEIHMQALAETIWDAMNESSPKLLRPEEWHAPYQDQIDVQELGKITANYNFTSKENIEARLKICAARCARLSYMTQDNQIDYQKDLDLYDRLASSGHMSPFEHCAKTMTEEQYYSFIKGRVPTIRDEYGITNLEMMPYSSGHPIVGFKGLNPNNGTRYGWCNNFRGFIQQRYLMENKQKQNEYN